MIKIGVIHGRFQPLHLGHMEYLLAGMKRVNYMYIGITNPDPTHTKEDKTALHRSSPSSNPLTYFERYNILQKALFDSGYSSSDFCIVPFPINIPELLHYYTPKEATYFITIYDEWGEKKLYLLKSLNLKVEILWRRELISKPYSGHEIRCKILNDELWNHLVPISTFEYIKNHHIDIRIKELMKTEFIDIR
ncbi:MAG: nicotinate-nucleotide adenylyltransferase [Candidatus Zhuqueibacterota bacterium]